MLQSKESYQKKIKTIKTSLDISKIKINNIINTGSKNSCKIQKLFELQNDPYLFSHFYR